MTRELETAVAKAMARAGGGGKGGKAAAAADEDADDDTDTDADSEGGGEGGGSRAERLARSKAEKEALVAKLESWTSSGDADGWLAALQLVEGLPQAQRAERRLLPGYTSRVYKRLVRAIPGSLTRIGAGVGVHYALKPRWAEIVKAGRTGASCGAPNLQEALLHALPRHPARSAQSTAEAHDEGGARGLDGLAHLDAH